MNYNNLTITAYNRYSDGTRTSYHNLRKVSNIRFSTQYPGGLCAAAAFFIPVDVTKEWPLHIGDRIDISNGLNKPCWQGVITTMEIAMLAGQSGHACSCQGYWAYLLMRRNIHKPWADARIDQNTWRDVTTDAAYPWVSIDRQNRIRLTPKPEPWATNWSAAVTYEAPTGQTIKRIAFNYDLQEGSQSWTIGLSRPGANLWGTSTSGTGSLDHTLGTPHGTAYLYILSGANQTAPSGTAGTIYAEFSNIRVYTETGTITGQTIATYIATITPEISGDLSKIGTLSYDLGGHFVADPPMPYADVLASAAGFGDATYATWAAYVDFSDPGGDDKPRMALRPWPVTTAGTADYYISLEDAEINDSLRVALSLDEVSNYITEQHQSLTGGYDYTTPSDDAGLAYSAGTAAYGRLEGRGALSINTLGTAAALSYAKAYLQRNQSPRWKLTGGLTVTGFVRGAGGERIPASEIRAGKVIRFDNFLENLAGSRPTFVITATDYDDTSETCNISVGLPDALPAWLSRQLRKEGKLT